jgi:hydrogenase nickel incorporation protein HypB
MCTTCGCSQHETAGAGESGVRIDGRWQHRHDHNHLSDHDHHHHDHHHHDHHHPDPHHHGRLHDAHDYGRGLAGMDVPGLSQQRIIQIERNILAQNDAFAAGNRARLAAADVVALNLMSSPGSGKTSLLVRTIADLRNLHSIAVIEGDQQTSNDAERIRATGAPAIQVNTGKGCHLDAHMVGHALDALPLSPGGLLFIENVGNLVCPAAFDLGEAFKVVVCSVTEGEDKPIKYPDMFAAADVMLINKSDLIPHLDFDLALTIENARRVNAGLEIFVVSARTGEGMPDFYDWITKHAAKTNGTMTATR